MDFKRKTLEVLMDSESILVLGFEDALLGYSEIGDSIVAAYDQDMFIDILAEDMPFADAVEVFPYEGRTKLRRIHNSHIN
jgi:hypothetical protein